MRTDTPDQVALRTAAIEFSNQPPNNDVHDRPGLKANRKLMLAAIRLSPMTKRGYSREFTPKTTRRVRFEIDRIPPTLYDAVQAKAKREGISLRALTLTLWKKWTEE